VKPNQDFAFQPFHGASLTQVGRIELAHRQLGVDTQCEIYSGLILPWGPHPWSGLRAGPFFEDLIRAALISRPSRHRLGPGLSATRCGDIPSPKLYLPVTPASGS